MIEVRHRRRGLAMGNDQRVRRKRIVAERMVAMKVGVDQIEDGLVGHLPHGILYHPGHRRVYVRVDNQHAAFANDKTGIVDTGLGGDQGENARPQFLGHKLGTGRVELRRNETLRCLGKVEGRPAPACRDHGRLRDQH